MTDKPESAELHTMIEIGSKKYPIEKAKKELAAILDRVMQSSFSGMKAGIACQSQPDQTQELMHIISSAMILSSDLIDSLSDAYQELEKAGVK